MFVFVCIFGVYFVYSVFSIVFVLFYVLFLLLCCLFPSFVQVYTDHCHQVETQLQ